MIPQLGTTCLMLLLPVSFYSLGMTLIGARHADARLYRSGRHAAYAVCGLLTLACLLLIAGFVGNHFEIIYVASHSNRALPLFFKFAGLWAGLDGSLLFWAWLLGVMTCIALVQAERHLPRHVPYINVAAMVIIGFFGIVLLFEANPFATSLDFPFDGRGLNPLLQATEMVVHPPSLYLGYVSASIPFALMVSGLLSGEMGERWLRMMRGWLLFCWLFLSVGNLLGMHWAYVELGWGGFWAWDPVENAAIMPWFTATAMLHSLIIQERRGMLRVWNVTLALLTFILTVLGTFLTRSGVVQSVHAFSNSTLGVYFGAFLAVMTAAGILLILARRHLLASEHDLDSLLSKEGAFLLNNVFFTVGAFTILWGTMLPTLAEALIGERMMLGPPFFNRMLAPIGIVLILLAGFGPILAWRKHERRDLLELTRWPATLGLAALTIAWVMGAREWYVLASTAGIAFTLLITFGEFGRGMQVIRRREQISSGAAAIEIFRHAPRRYGGYLVHVAMLLICVGIAGAVYHSEVTATLKPGERLEMHGYQIEFQGLRYKADDNQETIAGALAVHRNGVHISTLYPARNFYRASDQPTTEAAIHRAWNHDLYTIIGAFDVQKNEAEFKVMHNPMVSWMWIGGLLLLCGTGIVAWPMGQRKRQAEPARRVATAVMLVAVLGSGFALPSAVAQTMPEGHQEAVQLKTVTPEERTLVDAASKMVCLCSTCPRINLAECGCGYARERREEVMALIRSGKNAAEVIVAMIGKYGEEILAEMPLRGWQTAAIWMPLLVLGGAIGGVSLTARRWIRRNRQRRQ
ncbi:MAG: cytochrome c biogenesis protein CcsA [Deltaproteobacteria bacterium]|nr:cytochrome c biogenesis protein CcsA [Deltaproteobacteria bacterium]